MLKKDKHLKYKIYNKKNYKKIWINADEYYSENNIMYKALADYIFLNFGEVILEKGLNKLYNNNKENISIFLKSRNNKLCTKQSTFIEVFSYIIETHEENDRKEIDDIYQYVRKWVYGTIFDRKINKIPDYIKTESDVMDSQINELEKAFSDLPKTLKKYFLEDGWHILITSEEFEDGLYKGMALENEKRLIVSSRNAGTSAIAWHEIGHYLDFQTELSDDDSFQKIYIKERKRLKKLYKDKVQYEYAISNTLEYFASLFAFYMQKDKLLEKCVPESYEFIDYVMKKLSQDL